MAEETRFERRLEGWIDRATTPRGAAMVIATATIVITLAAGLLMRMLDRDNYPSLGDGLWWAVQTTTTVGYGDNVPTTVPGRLLAVLVMFFGIGFLTVITAAITSTFVARSRVEQKQADAEAPTVEHFNQLDRRLERIEAVLSSSSHPEPPAADAEPAAADHFRRLDERLGRIEAALTRSS
jgi:voltage-gated potassium channel